MAGLGRLKATLGMGADDLQQTSAPVSTHRNQHQLIGSDSSTLNPFPLGNWRYSPSWLLPQLEVFSPHPRAAGKSAEQLSQKGNLHPPPAANTPSFLCFAPRREGPGMQLASAPGFGTSTPNPGPRVIFLPCGDGPASQIARVAWRRSEEVPHGQIILGAGFAQTNLPALSQG